MAKQSDENKTERNEFYHITLKLNSENGDKEAYEIAYMLREVIRAILDSHKENGFIDDYDFS